MRIAAVMTVKNEDDVIYNNIIYHKHIGVTDFYIYLDHSTDNTKKLLLEIPDINIKSSSIPNYMIGNNTFKRYINKYSSHHTARQIINCFDAIEMARKNSIDWMISIDPDELICLDKEKIAKESLTEFLDSLESNIQAVTFPTLEVIPRKINYTNVFAEETFFKAPYSYGEGRRIMEPAAGIDKLLEPEILSSCDEIKYKWNGLYHPNYIQSFCNTKNGDCLQKALDVPHLIAYNPNLNSQVCFDWYVGHFIGKQAFRINRDLYFKSLHRVSVDNQKNEITSGYLLHYNNYSYNKFLKKYKAFSSHPKTYTSGSSVDNIKIFFRDLVNFSNLSDKMCAEVFVNTFLVNPRIISMINEKWKGSIEVIESVKEYFVNIY